MVLSKACDYALRAAIYVASRERGEFVSILEISETLDVSFHFLTKTLQTLTQKSILTSSRGPKGGVALARPAEEITLMEVIIAVDGRGLFDRCVLGLDYCGDDHPCPLHGQWRSVKEEIREIFERNSLADMAAQMKHTGWRLADLIE